MQHMFHIAWFPLWFNGRSFLRDILLTQVDPDRNIFQKIILYILSNLCQELTQS